MNAGWRHAVAFFAFIIIASSVHAAPVLRADFDITKDGSVTDFSYRVIDGRPSENRGGDITVMAFGKDNEILHMEGYDLSFFLYDAGIGLEKMHYVSKLPFSNEIRRIGIYYKGIEVYSAKINACNENGACGERENAISCPADCPQSGKDGWCMKADDGICDPDCAEGFDPDCRTQASEACGNGVCDAGEHFANCKKDCSGAPDGICDGLEDGICDPDCGFETDADCDVKKDATYNKHSYQFAAIAAALALIFIFAVIKINKKRKANYMEGAAFKGQFSFLTKGFMLIFILIVMAIVINQITFYQYNSEKITREYELASSAMGIAGILSNSQKCLSYEESSETYSRVLDINKIEEFASKYSDIEPECARNYFIGYNATVELLPIDINYEYMPEEEKTVLQRMLDELKGEGAVFVIDVSRSMKETIGKIRKDECVRKFLEGFADYLGDDKKMAIVTYGTKTGQPYNEGCGGGRETDACHSKSPLCGADVISDVTVISGNKNEIKSKIASGVYAQECTPMAHGLSKGFEIAEKSGLKDIVVLSDGCENCGGDSICLASKHPGIRVHSIGFGERKCSPGEVKNCVCEDKLETLSKNTGGSFFVARDCEELIRPPNKVKAKVEKRSWSFGTKGHSEGKALDASVSLSLPVAVKKGDELLAGFLKLDAYQGDLETVAGLIEYVCITKESSEAEIFIDAPMWYDGVKREICQEGESGKACRRIGCAKYNIEMDEIKNKGRYKIRGVLDGYTVRIFA